MSGNFHANQNTQMTANNPIVKLTVNNSKIQENRDKKKPQITSYIKFLFKINWKMWPGLYLAPT